MIIDNEAGTILTPGNGGKDCLGNGKHSGVEICCDECDHYLCCFGDDYPLVPKKRRYPIGCADCHQADCPRVGNL